MQRADAIEKIRSREEAIRSLGAEAVYLFGSTVRDEARPDSDVDIFIDRNPNITFGMTEFCRIKDELTGALGVEIDLATRASLHPALREEIEKTAIRVL